MNLKFNTMKCTLYHGDCLIEMDKIPDKSVDMILCDLPYGTTQNKWDLIIPFDKLWEHYERIIKDNGAIVLFASQPFTSALVMSNSKIFRYSLVWDKVGTTGFQTAKIMPLRRHEDICIFYKKSPIYNPKMEIRGTVRQKGGSTVDNGCYGKLRSLKSINNEYYPTSILSFSNANKIGKLHPTQKPVALLEYLIKTYTNEGELVLDNTMGSGSTGVACKNTNRNFIGIEMDENYFNIAQKRINEAQSPENSTNTFF